MLFFRVCNYAAKLRIKSKTTKNNVISPAGSLCPIQNSQFSPRPTCPTCPTCRIRPPNSKFRIQNSLPVPQSPVRLALPALSAFSYLPPIQSFPLVSPVPLVPLVSPVPLVPLVPPVSPVSLVPLVSSVLAVPQFTIHKFPSHYLKHSVGLKNSFLYGR